MRVLICIATEQSVICPTMGSERQTMGYARALSELGHEVHLVNILYESPDWSIDYDVCHLINASGLKGPYSLVAQLARQLQIPVIISPVYWPILEIEEDVASKLYDNKMESDTFRALFNLHMNGLAKMLLEADFMAPNASIEMDKVIELLTTKGVNNDFIEKHRSSHFIVHNGIDVQGEISPALSDTSLRFDESLEKILKKRFILCVARVEARKNQAILIEAMKGLWEEDGDLQLVLMGDRSAMYVKYLKEFVKGKNVLYCPPGPPGAVMKMMRRCAVHAMPSFVETPGLVNLEAAALNKPIVVADRGSVREYFGDRDGVYYCDPHDAESVRASLRLALDRGEVSSLGEYVRRTYSYTNIANQLEFAYSSAISLHNREK